MNCKPGDLAVYVNRLYAGRILEVVAMDEPGYWLVKPKIRGVHSVADKNLRPIRDQPGEDETLQWAGLPHKETA